MSLNRVSKIFGFASCIIQGLCNDTYPYSMYRLPFNRKMLAKTSQLSPKNERQWSVNNFWSCILHNPRAVQQSLSIMKVLDTCIGKNAKHEISTTFEKWASTESQQFLVLHLAYWKGCVSALIRNWSIGCLYRQKCYWHYRYCLLNINVNRTSTVFVLAP